MKFSKSAWACLSLNSILLVEAEPWHKSTRSEISYLSRPDLLPQKLNVTTLKPELVTPGYFFISPYDRQRETQISHAFTPGQSGPHIYDEQGDLVWSGVFQYDQRSAYNLDVATYHGEEVLTFSVRKMGDVADVRLQECTGVIMDSSYNVVKEILANNGTKDFNMHEFNIVDDGKHALIIDVNLKTITKPDGNKEEIEDNGFQEIDVATGQTIFEWWAHDHVPITWIWKDPYHINALDKTADGNYLVSIRHISTVFLISGKDGSIIWRLGGQENSSFKHVDDFEFRFQHHVRVHERNQTHTLISFLDNNAWEGDKQPEGKDSAGVYISLATAQQPMTATLLRRWQRPDGINAFRRGSTQVLPNGHAVVGWGELGYLSEFTWDNELVQEVRFEETRFEDYRAYKLNFTGYSNEPIAIVSQVHAASAESVVTSIYVSWNGATEVKGWNFYRAHDKGKPVFLAYQDRQGFETTVTIQGYHEKVYAQPVMKDGKKKEKSRTENTMIPGHLSAEQHDILQNWIQQSSSKTQASSPKTDTKEISMASSGGFYGVAGCILGIVGTCIAFCMTRRKRNDGGAWERVLPSEELADESDKYGDRGLGTRMDDSVHLEEVGRPLFSTQSSHKRE